MARARILHSQKLWFIAAILAAAPRIFGASDSPENSSATEKLTRMNCGARIECVAPNGQTGHVSKLPEPGATALIMDDDTVSCLLQEGETDFVVELPKARLIDRLTFLNENARARGELEIAVSNERLKADSAEWVAVEGVIPFSHKHLFGVSLVGIEAKFVRLAFRVEKPGHPAPIADSHAESSKTNGASVDSKPPFATSALPDALDSRFAALHSRGAVLLTANDASVGPLSATIR